MNPTEEYIGTAEHLRSRLEARLKAIAVIIENLEQKSTVYLSLDSGITWESVGWKRSSWALLSADYYSIIWPPTRVASIELLSETALRILHLESRWEDDIYVHSTLSLSTRRWTIMRSD